MKKLAEVIVGIGLLLLVAVGGHADTESEVSVSPEPGTEVLALSDEAQCRTDSGSLFEAEREGSTEQRGFDTCPLYHRCICQCQQERICCNNGGGQNCVEEELDCFDTCIAFLSPGQQCGTTTCSLNPFCNFP